jgi:hypothetical protein
MVTLNSDPNQEIDLWGNSSTMFAVATIVAIEGVLLASLFWMVLEVAQPSRAPAPTGSRGNLRTPWARACRR